VAEEFEVSIQIHDGTTATILGDLHDHDNGLSVGVPVDDDADDEMDEITTDSPFVLGDFVVTSKPSVGRLEVALTTTGDTWPLMMTNYRTARDWWRQAGNFYVDVTLKGETTRYLCRRPNVTSEPVRPIHLLNNRRQWLVSFPVQPNPVVL
jgi:hypothetical protein